MQPIGSLKQTAISLSLALLMAITSIIPIGLPAKAATVDASVGLDFGDGVAAGEDILENSPVGASYTYSDVVSGVDAIVTVTELTNHKNNLSTKIDDYSSTDPNSWIRADITRKSGTPSGEYTVLGFRINFVSSSNNSVPVVLDGLRVNAYDVDRRQFIELSSVDSYQLTTNTIINKVTNLGDGTIRFVSDNIRADDPVQSGVHSRGESRVQVNFAPTSVLEIRMGVLANGSQDLDFSTNGDQWADTSGDIPAPVETIPPIESTTGTDDPAEELSHESTEELTPEPGEIVELFGENLDEVTEVFVGGIEVEIVSRTKDSIEIKMPTGLTGPLDIELKSPSDTLLLENHITIGTLPEAGARKATKIVGGFGHNSRKLTARMKSKIDRWLEKNSDLSTLTCTGFTSLPRRTTDVELSTNRGIIACAYAKTQRADVTTAVSQGIEDPRPGSTVRRVRLVLTP